MKTTVTHQQNVDNRLIFRFPNGKPQSESKSQEISTRFPILFAHYFNFESDPIQNEPMFQEGGRQC